MSTGKEPDLLDDFRRRIRASGVPDSGRFYALTTCPTTGHFVETNVVFVDGEPNYYYSFDGGAGEVLPVPMHEVEALMKHHANDNPCYLVRLLSMELLRRRLNELVDLRVNPPLETEPHETDHSQPESPASADEEGVPGA